MRAHIGRAFVTLDGGGTWLPRDAGLPPGRPIPDIIVDPVDPLTAYLAADQAIGGRLFLTRDSGATWEDLTGSLPDGLRALSLAVDFATATIYLGTDYGVYSTADAGASWTAETINLPRVAVYNLRVDPVNRFVVAATHGRGMWRAPLAAAPAARPTIN